MTIRFTKSCDIPGLQKVLERTQLFPSDLLADMLAGFVSQDPSEDLWLTHLAQEAPVGFCYARPEPLTDGAWNMLAIAVDPDRQGQGIGAALTAELERLLRSRGQRVIIVDTSGTDDFAQTRAFYAQNGYEEEARIRDFWAEGDDKVIFRKRL